MKIIIIYLLATIALFSCVKPEKRYTKILTNDSRKYWNLVYESHLYDKKRTSLYPKFREYYNINGTRLVQWYIDSAFVNLEVRDIIHLNKWRLLGDSVIVFDEDDSVKIIMLINDTLKYRTKKGDTLVFRNSVGDTSFNNRTKRIQ